MIRPKALKEGSTIGLVAPSSPVRIERGVEKAVFALEKQGFKVVKGESCDRKNGFLSGTDEVRARDINNMFKDSSIEGVFCIRGGYGTPRILDKLEYDAVKSNPKIFIGYSDITAIHIALNQKCDLVTFHGPMAASDMIDSFDEFSEDSYMKSVTSTEALGILRNPDGTDIKTLIPGKASGRIVGGNLSLIAATMGTPYEIDTKGKLLLIEDIGEYTYCVDRMLTQLRLSGKFEDCEGIILGDFKGCLPQYEGSDQTLMEVFNDIILETKKPTIYNFMTGHCTPKITIPLGVEAVLDADNATLEMVGKALVP